MIFKKGDRVEVRADDERINGRIGEIWSHHNGLHEVWFIDESIPEAVWASEENLTLYTQPLEPDAPNPSSYYVFPGGVEVRHISAHLTSFGGQIVQYAARSTRLDGNNKGAVADQIRDMEKIADLAKWEAQRLKDQP